MRQRTDNLKKSFQCEIQAKVEDDAKKYFLSNNIIRSFSPLADLQSADEIEDFLVLNSNLLARITRSKSQLLAILKVQ